MSIESNNNSSTKPGFINSLMCKLSGCLKWFYSWFSANDEEHEAVCSDDETSRLKLEDESALSENSACRTSFFNSYEHRSSEHRPVVDENANTDPIPLSTKHNLEVASIPQSDQKSHLVTSAHMEATELSSTPDVVDQTTPDIETTNVGVDLSTSKSKGSADLADTGSNHVPVTPSVEIVDTPTTTQIPEQPESPINNSKASSTTQSTPEEMRNYSPALNALDDDTEETNSEQIEPIISDHEPAPDSIVADEQVSAPVATENQSHENNDTNSQSIEQPTLTEIQTDSDQAQPLSSAAEAPSEALRENLSDGVINALNDNESHKIQDENHDENRAETMVIGVVGGNKSPKPTQEQSEDNDASKDEGSSSVADLKKRLFSKGGEPPSMFPMPKAGVSPSRTSKSFSVAKKPPIFIKEKLENKDESLRKADEATGNEPPSAVTQKRADEEKSDVKRSTSSVAALKSKLGANFNPFGGMRGGPLSMGRKKPTLISPKNDDDEEQITASTEEAPELLSSLTRSRSRGAAARRRPSSAFIEKGSNKSTGFEVKSLVNSPEVQSKAEKEEIAFSDNKDSPSNQDAVGTSEVKDSKPEAVVVIEDESNELVSPDVIIKEDQSNEHPPDVVITKDDSYDPVEQQPPQETIPEVVEQQQQQVETDDSVEPQD